MELSQLCLFSGVLVFGMMTALWLLSLALNNSSIVDIFWGTGFVIINLAAFYFSQHTTQQTFLTVLVTLWGLRLSIHIFFRNKGKAEDFRYALWRKENGTRWWWVSFFKVFVLQGVLLSIIAVPLLGVQSGASNQSLMVFDYMGIMVWCIGFFFEAVGDYQLSRFKSDPSNKGKIMTSGVWRLTRHPNYFGDAAQWWGFFLFAASSGYWWTVFSPLLMTLLLMRVSGVTLLEKTMKSRQGYEEYTRSTNAFFPWVPKNQ
jgi:steroid 5-alpha reductase family enzyme